jgi:polyisoprenoid-binding protein YceI
MTARSIVGILIAAGTAVSASTAQQVVELDLSATTVRFELGATLHTVHGTAAMTGGRIVFDPISGAAEGEIVVDARSADTDNKKRDKKMHAKVLESERFSTIILRPVRISGDVPAVGSATITVEGELELHGDRHPVAIPVNLTVGEGGELELSATFEVPFVEWGLNDPSTFLLKVSKSVTVSVAGRGRLLDAEAPVSLAQD